MGSAFLVNGADYRTNNLGRVTPMGDLPVQGILIIGPSTAYIEQQYYAMFVPTFSAQRSVTWSIVSGSNYASIDQTGLLTVYPNQASSSVTIRCTSDEDSDIFFEKTVVVSSVALELYDWILSDGTDLIVMPGLGGVRNAQAVLRCELGAPNTYMFQAWRTSESTEARLAAYNNGSGLVSYVAGNSGYKNTVQKTDIVYRYVWNIGTENTADSSIYIYNDATDAQIASQSSLKITFSAAAAFFCAYVGLPDTVPDWTEPTALTAANSKLYGFTLVDNNNITLAEYIPARYHGKAGLYDTVSSLFRGGLFDTGGIVAGND